jgi:mannosyltransferase
LKFRKLFFKNEWVLLSALLLMAVGLRLLFIAKRGIWYDDAFSILLSRQNFSQIFFGTAADTMPPLYYILLHFWMLVSDKVFWIRGLNILVNLILMIYAYLFVKEIASKEAGYIGVFLFSISPFLIYHAQEVRMYMILALCQFAYLYYFVRWMRKGKPVGNAIGMILFGAGALYSHNLAIFGLIIPGIYLLLKKEFKSILFWGGCLFSSLVLFIPWLILVPGQIEKIQTAFWTPRPGLLEIIQSIYSLLSFLPQPTTWMMVSGVLCFQILVMLFWISWKDRKQISHVGLLLVMIFTVPMLLFVVSYLMRPVYVARGFILSLLGLYVLAGVICWRYWGQGLDKIILGLFIVLTVVSLPFQYTYAEFPRSPFENACDYLKEEMAGKDADSVILHDNKLSAFPCIVYQPDLEQGFLGDEPGSHNDTYAHASQVAMDIFPENSVSDAVNDKREVYFVVFERAIEEYELQGNGGHPIIDYLDAEFVKQDVVLFNDLAVYHYER